MSEVRLHGLSLRDRHTVCGREVIHGYFGTAAEFTQLRDALDKALVGGPQVVEARTSIGTDIRILVDRLGMAVQGN